MSVEPTLAARLLEHHGAEAQLDQTIEECAELILAIRHYKRGRIGHVLALRDEIADVELMIEQLVVLVALSDPDAMDRTRKRKREKALASIGGAS